MKLVLLVTVVVLFMLVKLLVWKTFVVLILYYVLYYVLYYINTNVSNLGSFTSPNNIISVTSGNGVSIVL